MAIKCEENVESISVITPYAAQTRLVRALALDYRKTHETSLRCATVHQFQGSESDVVIFDAVESYPGLKPGWLMGKESGSIKRLINVAVTRARGKLVAVTNKRFWNENYQAGSTHTFYRLVQYLSQKGNVVQHVDDRSLEKLIMELSVKGGPQYYLDQAYTDELLRDITNAKNRIVVSLPSGKLDESVERHLYDQLADAKKSGVSVLVKCNDYASLPAHWKSIAWGTQNAIFPVILIDDKITWYGAPHADWKFSLKNNLLLGSSCKIACRIRGEYTAEIIRSLSELDYRETLAGKTALVEKEGTTPDDEKKGGGLAEYASHLRKCTGCGKYMIMTKGRSGKTILWCNVCRKTELLSKEDVNQYIYKNGVKCPEHKCAIEARVGQYGLYIRCDRGHSLKLENI